jgi:ubiquinol-cytochrome c reductase cytochrome b subunit
LDAPADPAESYSSARPETYFLFLFQLLKYLESLPPVVGAVLVPALVLLTLALLPLVGRWELGHRFNVAWVVALLAGAGVLTLLAWREDHNGTSDASRHYLAGVDAARVHAERAVALAGSPAGIPPTGALAMLRNDPKTQGPKLFRQHCAACHGHAAPEGTDDPSQNIAAEKPSASNLWHFGTRGWIAGVLDPRQVGGPHYFGGTALAEGDMATWVKDTLGAGMADLAGKELAETKRNIENVSLALATEAELVREQVPDLEARVAAGRDAMINEFACIDCHKFQENGDLGQAPDLTGYASRAWLRAMISNPKHERFYPETNDRMPAFAESDDPGANRLSPQELDLLVAWLRGEWYEPNAEMNPPTE